MERATQAALTGNQFDDAASAQGIVNFFVRASSCGALAEAEIAEITDLSLDGLRGGSFAKIMYKPAEIKRETSVISIVCR